MYNELVQRVVASHQVQCDNQFAAQRLHDAFVQLLNPVHQVGHPPLNPTRSEKRAFRDRFDNFLNDISGLLSLRLLNDGEGQR